MPTNDDSDGAAAPAGDARKGERDGRCRRQYMNGNNDGGYKNRPQGCCLFLFSNRIAVLWRAERRPVEPWRWRPDRSEISGENEKFAPKATFFFSAKKNQYFLGGRQKQKRYAQRKF